MEIERCANVRKFMTVTPEDAANISRRSQLLLAITDAATGWNLTQAQTAARLGITQLQLNDLLRGRIDKFSLVALVELSARAGLPAHPDIYGAG